MYKFLLNALFDNYFNVIGFEKDSKGNINRNFNEDDIEVYQYYNNPTFIARDSSVFLYFLIYINKELTYIDINIIKENIQFMKRATNIRHDMSDADLVGYFNEKLKIKINIIKLPFGKIYF